MAALVQSYPQQSSTVTMLQTRPSSASSILQSSSQGQGHLQYPSSSQIHRNSYHNLSGIVGSTTYRGHVSTSPVAPYAFTTTPSLTNFKQQPGQYGRADQRTLSAPVTPTLGNPEIFQGGNRARYPAESSVSTTSSSSSSEQSSHAKPVRTVDDSAIPSQNHKFTRDPRPHSMVLNPRRHSMVLTPPPTSPVSSKPSPDRYRRGPHRLLESSGQSLPTGQSSVSISSGSSASGPQSHFPASQQLGEYPGSGSQPRPVLPHNAAILTAFDQISARRTAADDLLLQHSKIRDDAGRYRRRSIHDYNSQSGSSASQLSGSNQHVFQHGISAHPLRSSPVTRPSSSPERSSNYGAMASSKKIPTQSWAKRDTASSVEPSNATTQASATVDADPKHDQNQHENTPPASFISDLAKRASPPSPLSRPMAMNPQRPVSKDSFSSAVSAALQNSEHAINSQGSQNGAVPQSPAARQLAALNNKESKKSTASRLRRAFSFGSAAELRKISIENNAPHNAADVVRLRKERSQSEQDAEQARIVRKQEEGGLGTAIYSSQGHLFSASTDNISISSTASSASVMIRKMGKEMKKSTRSLVGLFRPKSVIGVSAADEPSLAEVSIVTVEAQREITNVNADPHDQAGRRTSHLRLEKNAVDVTNTISLESNDSPKRDASPISDTFSSRKGIHVGERERAEVLASVKKGILKRSGAESGNSSPTVRAIDSKMPNFNLPLIPHVNDSPLSSAPSTPPEDMTGHRRTGSVTLGGEDFFMSALKFRGDTKSMPGTPLGTLKRNATFSPRIQFHDTWPSGEYDRRGEIATCNRLTPMLAQQIKEELNTFKMEMEVHENSKVYTHFF